MNGPDELHLARSSHKHMRERVLEETTNGERDLDTMGKGRC